MKIEIAKAIALLTTEYDLKEFTDERIDAWMRALSQFPAGTVTRSRSGLSNYHPIPTVREALSMGQTKPVLILDRVTAGPCWSLA